MWSRSAVIFSIHHLIPEQFSIVIEHDLNDQCLVLEQGVYEFPRLTLLGFDTNEPQVRRLSQLGLKVFVHHLSADIHYKLGSAGKFHLLVVAGEGRGQQTRGRRD